MQTQLSSVFSPKIFLALEQRGFTEAVYAGSTKRKARSSTNEGTGTKYVATFAARILDE